MNEIKKELINLGLNKVQADVVLNVIKSLQSVQGSASMFGQLTDMILEVAELKEYKQKVSQAMGALSVLREDAPKKPTVKKKTEKKSVLGKGLDKVLKAEDRGAHDDMAKGPGNGLQSPGELDL